MTQDDLLQKIRGIIQEENKPLTQRLDRMEAEQKRQGEDIKRVDITVGQIKSATETLRAGQEEIRETMATKADINDLRAELINRDKVYERRIENLEENTETPNPFKH